MAGVPLDYNESLRDKEEDKNVELRKQALFSIINSIQNHRKNNLFGEETLNS